MQLTSLANKVQRPYGVVRFWSHNLFRPFRWSILVLASLLPLVLFTYAVPESAYAAGCGDAILDPGEECDDGNVMDGDCCSSGCMNEPAGSPCDDDGNACTDDVCDGAGLCYHPNEPNQIILSFAPVADAYTEKEQPTTNFGAEDVLLVDGTPRQRTYLRFDVSGITGLPIESAVVRMETTADEKAGSITAGDMYLVTDNTWDELTLTHDNRPDMDGPLLSSVGEVEPEQTVDFDVTAAIIADGTYSFGIDRGSSNGVIYHSRDAAAGQPQLIVSLVWPCDDGDACTQTDVCVDGICVGTEPVVCTASDQCHDAGTCDSATGLCSDPAAANGSPCDDADACTQIDGCMDGICVGTEPVVCTASDQCHDAGTCDPATGICSDPATANGSPCDDADACTQIDSCMGGICVGADPIICTASNQCHDAGTCDPATGLCSDPTKADGSACDDGNPCTTGETCSAGSCGGGAAADCDDANECTDDSCDPASGCVYQNNGGSCDDGNLCTQTDSCIEGICVGADPIVCTAADQCHEAGTCHPTTGGCSNPAKADGAACDDGDVCTEADMCSAGACTGDPVVCIASDQCHDAGTCDPATGQCSNPAKTDGATCDDGNPCTQTDRCAGGSCSGTSPVMCTPSDQCHDAGTCDPATGGCSNPAKADGSPCDDSNTCSSDDICVAGNCVGDPLPDSDGDGFCDGIDLCPQMPDPAQVDSDNDGVGDLCQCTAPAPGRCIAGGGSKRSDCLLEFMSAAPVTLNKRGTKVKSIIRCTDGDIGCDLDGAKDGQCTFGVAFCFGNADPRYPRCTPSAINTIEVLQPKPARSESAGQIEEALGALGIEVRRRGQVIADSTTPVGDSQCSPLVRLVAPAPNGKKRSLQNFQLRATAMTGKRDKDRFTLVCE